MAKINLLPWRDKLRAKRKKEFIQSSGLAAMLGAFVIVVWSVVLALQTENQANRNDRLKAEITKLDAEIGEVEELKKKRALLIDRMKVIQNLQTSRPLIVHIFDELVRTLPDGVYYTSVIRVGRLIKIKGKAESNEQVAALMRKLGASKYFENPLLSDVSAEKSNDKNDAGRIAFALEVREEGVTTNAAPSKNKDNDGSKDNKSTAK